MLPPFQRANPTVGIELRELTTVEQIAQFGTQIDLGIVRDADPVEEAHLLPLITERLIVALSLTHALSDRQTISLSELSADNFIVFPRDRVPHGFDRFVELCRSCGFSPRIGQRALQHATVLGLVETGYGVALLPESVRDSARPGIAMVNLSEPNAQSQLALLTPATDRAPLVDAFVASARRVASVRR